MNAEEMRDLIGRVARQFERDREMRVTSGAENELLQPAIPHLAHVTNELAANRITTGFLESCVRTVLDNAHDIAVGARMLSINEVAVRDSMTRYCPYLFWC